MNYVPGSSVMPFESTSRVSRVTTGGHTIEETTNSLSSTVFDIFFFIIDELSRSAPPNSLFVFFQFFISFYQYYITSYLPSLPEKWDFSVFPDKALRYLTYPVDFGILDSNIYETGIPSIIILVLSCLILIYLIVMIIYYHINKIFPRHNAQITRFIVSYIIPLLLSPSCYNIGISFNSIFNDNIEINPSNYTQISNGTNTDIIEPSIIIGNKSLYIASTVFGVIFYLILIFFFYTDIMMRTSTPYIEDTPLSSWDGVPLFLCIFGSSFIILFSRLIKRLPTWSYYFLIICFILYNSYNLYQMFFYPMIKQWMNIIMSSIIFSGIIASLFQLFPIPSIYRLLVPLGVFVVSIPVFTVIFRSLRKKIVSKEIEEINLRNENNVLRYLRLTVADRCADFITFKWIKPVNQNNSTTNVIAQVAQIISFFPSESQNLKFYISLLSKKNDLSLDQRFLFFQLRRVHVLRQSNTSKQLNDDLAEISKVTNQTIASFSQFLIRIIDERQQLTIDRLNYLSRLNRATNSLCHEAMGRYPNNSRLLFLFSRYVIECQADFKGGVALFQEGQLIEHSKRATVDFAFRSMVNLFPSYLYKRILDYKGKNILNRRRSKSGSSMSVDSVSNDKNNPVSDTDIESNEKMASSVLDTPRLRFALRKAVNNMNSVGISIITFSSILRFLLSFIVFIVIVVVASNFLDDRRINYQNIATVGTLRKSLDLSLFRMAKLWSLNLGLSPKEENINASLGSDVTLQDYHNFSVGPKSALFSDAVDSIHSIEALGHLLSQVKYQESMNISDKWTTDFVQYRNISFCNRKNKNVVHSETSVRYFSLYLLNQIVLSSNLDLTYDDPSDWKDDECVCEVILNMRSVINVLTDQSSVLVSQEEELSKAVRKDIIIFFCITIPIVFAVYLSIFFIGYVKMNMEFQQIFDVLNLLPIKIYKEASKPIALFQPDTEQTQEAVTQSEHKGCQKVSILLPAFLSTFIITGCLIGICFLILDVNNKFYSLVKWLEIGSGRTPLLIETVTNAIFAGIYGYLGDTDYTTLVYHLELVFNYSQQLLYQHKTLIWGADDSTSCNNFSEKLDSLHFTNTCVINLQAVTFKDNYRCISLDQQIMTFNKFAKDVYLTLLYAQKSSVNSTDDFNDAFINVLNGYEAINLHYLGITYLLPKLEACQDILNEGINLKISQLKEYSLVIALCTLAAEFILFIIEMLVVNNLKYEYNIVRILIARLPPLSVIQNSSLVELMTGQSDIISKKQLTPVMIHIRYCSNSVIVFDKQCKIQMINETTSEVFGFTKEQLFHAHLSTVINNDECQIIQDKINRNVDKNVTKSKKNKNKDDSQIELDDQISNEDENQISKLAFLLNNSDHDNIDLNNNNSNGQITHEKVDLYNNPLRMMAIGIKDDGTKIILSVILTYLPEPDDVFALIMKDDTKIFINEEEIKRAKQRTIDIMNQVLPQAISQNGKIKENISFSIKLATVITIKILNFNDQIPHISSVQAIRSMSELFTYLDNQLSYYPNLTKTSVISESYQVIGGLFNPSTMRRFSSRNDDDPTAIDFNEFTDYDDDPESESQVGRTRRRRGSTVSLGRSAISTSASKRSVNSSRSNNDIASGRKLASSNESATSSKANLNSNASKLNNNDGGVRSSKTSLSGNKLNNNNESATSSKTNINSNASKLNNKNESATSSKTNLNNNASKLNNNDGGVRSSKTSLSGTKLNSNNESATSSKTNINGGTKLSSNGDEHARSSKGNVGNNGSRSKLNSSGENARRSKSSMANANGSCPGGSIQFENINNDANNNATPSASNANTSRSNASTTEMTLSGRVKHVRSRKSIYDIKSLNSSEPVQFSSIVLDSIYYAFNCFSVTNYLNTSTGSNLVIGIGISSGGPITAGTLGKEHIQFEVVGGTVKTSFIVCNSAESGDVVITEDVFDIIKDVPEAKTNLIFEKYKKLELLHSKKVNTYLVKASEALEPHSDNSGEFREDDGDDDDDDGDGDNNEDQIEMMEELQAIPSDMQLPIPPHDDDSSNL